VGERLSPYISVCCIIMAVSFPGMIASVGLSCRFLRLLSSSAHDTFESYMRWRLGWDLGAWENKLDSGWSSYARATKSDTQQGVKSWKIWCNR
jgi:hypothetical protein